MTDLLKKADTSGFSFDRSLFIDRETELSDSLEAIEQVKNKEVNDGLTKLTHEAKQDSIPEGIKSSFSLPDFGSIEIDDKTIDKLLPTVGIAGAWGGSKLLGWKSPSMPEGIWPKTKARTRKYGAKGAAFTLAYRAAEWGREHATETLGLNPKLSYVAGGAAGLGVYKALPALANLIASEVKLGMAHEAVPRLIKTAGMEAFRASAKVLGKEGGYKTIVKGAKIGMEGGKWIQASLAEKTAREAMEKKLIQEMSTRMGPKRAKTWLDVGKQLVKPNVAMTVGKYLGKIAPKIAAKLAASATATAIPEPVSTTVGLLGLAWTAYDVFKLIQYYPELKKMIFEDAPAPTEESIEGKIIGNFIEEENTDYFSQQRHPTKHTPKS